MAALGMTVVTACGVEYLRSNSKLFGESILSLFLSGSLALAAVLFSSNKLGIGLMSVLFGSLTTVSEGDIGLIVALGLIILALVVLFFKELMMVTFDEEIARAEGISVKFFNFLIIILAAVVVAVSMRIVGVLLIGALMVVPVLTALQLGVGFKKTLLWAEVFSLIATVGGLFLSYVLDWASGGTIVLLALALFIVAVGVKKLK
jgi:zinc transport system permease protein